MSILEEVKKQIKDALINGDEVKKNLLRLVLGEVQLKNTSTDEDFIKVIRKIIEANNETIREIQKHQAGNTDKIASLQKENVILATFMPAIWDETKIKEFLSDKLTGVTNIGLGMKTAMASLKEANAPVDGKVVKQVVEALIKN